MTETELLPFLIGPYGAFVLALAVIVGIYRLYREERADGREDRKAVLAMTEVVKELTHEVRSLRESMRP